MQPRRNSPHYLAMTQIAQTRIKMPGKGGQFVNQSFQIVSRRRALASGLSAAALLSTQGSAQSKARALALIGDRYHNPDYIRVALDKVFAPLGIKADYTIGYDSI